MAEQRSDDGHPGTMRAGGARRLGPIDAIFAALAVIAALPALVVRYPESIDYLNHLARLYVLTAAADDPIHAFYRVHWHFIPNLGIELIAMPLAALLPLEAVMKIVWLICVLGMAAALWFFNRSLHGRTQATLLLGAIALLNLPLTVGLLSFTLGLALALVALGLWFRLGDRASVKSILMINAVAALIMVVHIAACASLALTLGGLYVLRRPYGVAAMAKRAAVIASGFVLPALMFILFVASHAASADAGGGGVVYLLARKFQMITAAVFTGTAVADIIGALFLWITLLIAVPLGARCEQRLKAPLLLWLAALVVLPFGIGSATIVDLREAVFPALLLIGALSFTPKQPARTGILVGVAIAAVVVRAAILIPAWRAHDATVASFRAIDGAVERGAKVLVASAPDAPGPCRAPRHWELFDEHTPVLLVIDRAAFVSTLFAKPDQQPIEPTPAVGDIALPDLGIVPWAVLASGANPKAEEALAAGVSERAWRVYARDWRKNYDYLALRRVNCPAEIPAEPDLVPVAESATYRLYRIVHGTP